MAPDFVAFLNVLVVCFVDQVGISFTLPVIVPYGRLIGASTKVIAFFSFVRGVGGIIATLWMPRLSDHRGRKMVLLLALFGRALGYFIQGAAGWSETASIQIFLFGRGLAGLFSGSQPVIAAYITEISGSDKELLKKRIVFNLIASQIAGIALQPISGCLASMSLQIPFFVCSGVGMLGLIWTLCVFREASEVRRTLNSSERNVSAMAQQTSPQNTEEEGSPVFDPVLLLCFTGFFGIVIVIVSIPFLTPILLTRESFGLLRETEEATQGAIAQAQGIVSVPPGLCNIFAIMFLYIPLTRWFGGGTILLVVGVISALTYSSIDFWVTKLWQLTLAKSLCGLCFGFMTPSVAPLIARYSNARYPKRLAFCQGMPGVGAQIAGSVGQNIMAFIYDEDNRKDMKLCWVILGVCTLIFTICLGLASFLVDRYMSKFPHLAQDTTDNALSETAGQSFVSELGVAAGSYKPTAGNGGQATERESLSMAMRS